MSSAGAIQTMQRAVIDYVQKSIPADKNFAVLGRVNGDKVTIGEKSYPFVVKVDHYVADGDYVYCILPDTRNVAAIVGVQ